MNPKVSIIIPCKDIDALTSECIDSCRQLDHDNFEIIVLPDDPSNLAGDAKLIATGAVSPGRKRNIGQKAGGFILSSFMVGGIANRYGSAKPRESNDIHSSNFIARRTVLEEIGGWNEKYCAMPGMNDPM